MDRIEFGPMVLANKILPGANYDLNFRINKRSKKINNKILVEIDRKIVRQKKRWALLVRVKVKSKIVTDRDISYLEGLYGQNFDLVLRRKGDSEKFNKKG